MQFARDSINILSCCASCFALSVSYGAFRPASPASPASQPNFLSCPKTRKECDDRVRMGLGEGGRDDGHRNCIEDGKSSSRTNHGLEGSRVFIRAGSARATTTLSRMTLVTAGFWHCTETPQRKRVERDWVEHDGSSAVGSVPKLVRHCGLREKIETRKNKSAHRENCRTQ